MNTSPPPESSSRSAAAPTRTTPGTIVIGSTCWAVMTPMIADPQTPRPSCVYYCTLRTPTPAIHHTKVHVKALDARLGALPCQESWWQRFRYVTLPMLRPTLFTVLTLGLIGTWQVFDQIYTGTQGGPSKTTLTPAYLSYSASFNNGHWGQGAAIAFVLFALIVALTILQRLALRERNTVPRRKRFNQPPPAAGDTPPPPPTSTGSQTRPPPVLPPSRRAGDRRSRDRRASGLTARSCVGGSRPRSPTPCSSPSRWCTSTRSSSMWRRRSRPIPMLRRTRSRSSPPLGRRRPTRASSCARSSPCGSPTPSSSRSA